MKKRYNEMLVLLLKGTNSTFMNYNMSDLSHVYPSSYYDDHYKSVLTNLKVCEWFVKMLLPKRDKIAKDKTPLSPRTERECSRFKGALKTRIHL